MSAVRKLITAQRVIVTHSLVVVAIIYIGQKGSHIRGNDGNCRV